MAERFILKTGFINDRLSYCADIGHEENITEKGIRWLAKIGIRDICQGCVNHNVDRKWCGINANLSEVTVEKNGPNHMTCVIDCKSFQLI